MRNDKIVRHLQERFGDPIGSYAGEAPVGVRSVEEDSLVCPGCGMMAIDGECGCGGQEMCSCGCGMTAAECGCGAMSEGVEPCAECGILEIEGEGCNCTHAEGHEIDEVAPPGKEKMVKALKKDPDVDNPWAVAWYMHGKEKKNKK